MLDVAVRQAKLRPHVLGPPPAGLVGCPAERNASKPNDLEPAFYHFPHLVGRVEALQYDVEGWQIHFNPHRFEFFAPLRDCDSAPLYSDRLHLEARAEKQRS